MLRSDNDVPYERFGRTGGSFRTAGSTSPPVLPPEIDILLYLFKSSLQDEFRDFGAGEHSSTRKHDFKAGLVRQDPQIDLILFNVHLSPDNNSVCTGLRV